MEKFKYSYLLYPTETGESARPQWASKLYPIAVLGILLKNGHNASIDFFLQCRLFLSDADAGSNSELSYSLESGDVNAFSIDQKTGTISSKKTFDRETKASYSLTVRVTDHGQSPLHDTTTVDITILDINDNSPEIKNLPATKQVTEGKNIGDTLFPVSASDKDLG